MSLELVNTFATLGTFLVIASTAIAAIVQLRHMRKSNQIEALAEFREGTQNPEMRLAERFVRHELSEKLRDPGFRYQLANQGVMTAETQSSWSDIRRVANFFENMGALVKNGLAEKSMVLDIFSTEILNVWKQLTPVVAIRRRASNDDAIWENFEYLAVLSQDWEALHPNGTYPSGVRHIDLNYPWLEADMQYAASL